MCDEILFIIKRDEEKSDSNDDQTSSSTSNSQSSSTMSSLNAEQSSVDHLLDSHGCVICSGAPACPECNSDEQCTMTTQTCFECPRTYCVSISEAYNVTETRKSLSSAEIGGIAGGLSGFFFILIMSGLYYCYRRFKLNSISDFEYGINEEMKELTKFVGGDGETINEEINETSDNVNKRYSQHSLSTMTNSVLTKASNVLNIVYVPGVTSSRPTKPPSILSGRRNTRKPTASMYSKGMSVYSKETYFSDLENASFYGGRVAMKGGNPTLVEIKQDDYNYDDEDDDRIILEDDEDDEDDDYFAEEHEENEENEDEEDEEDNDDRGSGILPININLKIPKQNHMEEPLNEDEIITDNPFSNLNRIDENENTIDNNSFALNIGIQGKPTERTVPNRYAALIEKKEQTNQLLTKPNNANNNPPYILNRSLFGESDSNSESSSDSDEENIEYLLQNSDIGTGGGNTRSTGSNTTYINGHSDPFSSIHD